MALRIRKDGRILCAALHKAKESDTYIPDNISEQLSGCCGEKPIIVTDSEPKHSMHGEWWWAGNRPDLLKEDKTIV